RRGGGDYRRPDRNAAWSGVPGHGGSGARRRRGSVRSATAALTAFFSRLLGRALRVGPIWRQIRFGTHENLEDSLSIVVGKLSCTHLAFPICQHLVQTSVHALPD